MNSKLIIFSGIITALVGAVIGLVASKIGQPNFDQLKYESQDYQDLYKKYALIGAGLGFAIGVGQECVRELKDERAKDLGNQDKWK